VARHSADCENRRVVDLRGPAHQRRTRKRFLLATFGDGEHCPCTWCGAVVDFETMQVDRFPICGHACAMLLGTDGAWRRPPDMWATQRGERADWTTACMGRLEEHVDGALGHDFRPGPYRNDNIVPSCAPCNALIAAMPARELLTYMREDGSIDVARLLADNRESEPQPVSA
jgi:hypothetical protein